MRPRDILNRRKNSYLLMTAIGFGSMMLLAFLDKRLPEPVYRLVSYAAIGLFACGVVLVYVGIRCPKCKAILGLKYVFAEETLGRCSRCGIDFDANDR